MRTKKAILILILLFAGMAALVFLRSPKPKAGPWKLADGSTLAFAGATYGKSHSMRYGNGLADFLYPVLTPALRKKFNCRVATLPAFPSSMVLWFQNKDSKRLPMAGTASITGMPAPFMGGQSTYTVVTVDENGMESAEPISLPWGWRDGRNLLECCALQEFPRRSREIKVRIYDRATSEWKPIAELTIPNRNPTNFPVWTAGPAPVSIETNGLKFSVTKFETGMPKAHARVIGSQTPTITRAEITATNDSAFPVEWRLRAVTARSATGESRFAIFTRRTSDNSWIADYNPVESHSPRDAQFTLEFPGTCWLQEPAWKLVLELERVTNFPPSDLWVIPGITIPAKGAINELDLKTNINGSEIEFVGLSNENTRWGAAQTTIRYPSGHEIKVRSPMRALDAHLKIAGIRDDQGREVGFTQNGYHFFVPRSNSKSSGPPGEDSYGLNIPEGARTIDVTLACPKSWFVELLARPTKATNGP